MSKYLMMVIVTALVVVAIINGATKDKTTWGKIETRAMVPDTLVTDSNIVTVTDDTEEITFKCRKEVTTGESLTDKPFTGKLVKPNSIDVNE